jgi:hypothetical protein
VGHTAKPSDDALSPDEIVRQLALLDILQLGRIITAAEAQRVVRLQEARNALVREEASVLRLDPTDLFARSAPSPMRAKKATKIGMKKPPGPCLINIAAPMANIPGGAERKPQRGFWN